MVGLIAAGCSGASGNGAIEPTTADFSGPGIGAGSDAAQSAADEFVAVMGRDDDDEVWQSLARAVRANSSQSEVVDCLRSQWPQTAAVTYKGTAPDPYYWVLDYELVTQQASSPVALKIAVGINSDDADITIPNTWGVSHVAIRDGNSCIPVVPGFDPELPD